MNPSPNIQDIDKLKEQLAALSKQVETLARDNESLAKENTQLATDVYATCAAYEERMKKQKAEFLGKIDQLLEQIKLLNARFFGSRSERVIPDQLSLFNLVEAEADKNCPEPTFDQALDNQLGRRGGKRKINYEDLETIVIDHVLEQDDLICEQCGAVLEEMNVEVTRMLKLVPAHFIVEEHRRHTYICKPCAAQNAVDGSVATHIKRAAQAHWPIPHSFATPSLLSYVINAKYTNAMPLYRLEEDFKTLNANISRQNMANWIVNVHQRWLCLIHAHMKEKLLEHDIIHADETPVQVLKEPNREAKQKSYMWLFRTANTDTPLCIYEYHPTRSGKIPAQFLQGWSGTLTTDGYVPYFKLGPKITNTACLVHVRRKFAEIVKIAGGDSSAESVESLALRARRHIDEMFAIDSSFDAMTPEAREHARKEQLAPKMDAFERWAREQINTVVPKMALYNALKYALDYWPYVKNVLGDGRLELSNNIAERSIKPFVIGRKNWLFSDTPRGANASAAMYSIVVSAKLNGVNPRAYLEWLLTEMPNTPDIKDANVLERFMPWSDAVPAACRMKPTEAQSAAQMPDEPILDVDPTIYDED